MDLRIHSRTGRSILHQDLDMLADLARCLVMVEALLVDLQSLLHLLGAIGCLVAGKALGQLLPHLFEELLKDLDGLRDSTFLTELVEFVSASPPETL